MKRTTFAIALFISLFSMISCDSYERVNILSTPDGDKVEIQEPEEKPEEERWVETNILSKDSLLENNFFKYQVVLEDVYSTGRKETRIYRDSIPTEIRFSKGHTYLQKDESTDRLLMEMRPKKTFSEENVNRVNFNYNVKKYVVDLNYCSEVDSIHPTVEWTEVKNVTFSDPEKRLETSVVFGATSLKATIDDAFLSHHNSDAVYRDGQWFVMEEGELIDGIEYLRTSKPAQYGISKDGKLYWRYASCMKLSVSTASKEVLASKWIQYEIWIQWREENSRSFSRTIKCEPLNRGFNTNIIGIEL